MTTLRELIHATTTGDATIAGLAVGGVWADKLQHKPTYPLIIFRFSSRDESNYRAHDSTPTERMVTFVQFECYSNRDQTDDAAKLADAVEALWSGYSDKPDVGYAFVPNRFSNPNDQENTYREIVEVNIEHARVLT